jgi:hypothetical protein
MPRRNRWSPPPTGFLVFDADEFLCINHPSGTLEGLLDDTVALGANGVVITWRIFGSGGVVDWSARP